ncbi:MAG: LytTR family DNA-binding domain-containing protein [Bacteroidota bacterium]|nr:LytTR family DNA-binding domain-containing protein [Bacteroidota bacterium]
MNFNLSQPYPLNESIKWRLLNSFLFGTFVFLFLFIFQPFELSKLPYNILPIALGYGAVCFVMMAILNLGVCMSFPNCFSENSWTTKKEILWTILNVFLIGLANYIFSFLIKITAFTWENLFLFEAYTIAVAVFPLTISILLNQVRLNNKFEKQAQQLNEDIEEKQSKFIAETVHNRKTIGIDEFELMVDNFLYAKADDNYVTIYYINNETVSRKMLRNTLKNVYLLFTEHTEILKCHKSYIVNLNHVQRISGNAQGYKLHLKGTDEILPVSRTLNENIKLYFADYH